ncbi:hypothetical protein RvVAT039_pl02830 (plasmid) [Agrobacterium vitis]|nr:hypothetical protein RvVAT039_pl02830 [Agrobacterium vitis]
MFDIRTATDFYSMLVYGSTRDHPLVLKGLVTIGTLLIGGAGDSSDCNVSPSRLVTFGSNVVKSRFPIKRRTSAIFDASSP